MRVQIYRFPWRIAITKCRINSSSEHKATINSQMIIQEGGKSYQVASTNFCKLFDTRAR